MTLRSLAPGLHVVDHPLVVGGLHLGTRTTVLELAPGRLALVAPGPLSDADVGEIRGLGEVEAIIAPNSLHHLFIPAARAAFPAAKLHATASFAERLPALTVDHTLGGAAFAGALDQLAIGGAAKVAEVVFVHRASRTLIATDLAFNVRGPKPFFTRAVMKLNDGWERFGPTRLFATTVKDTAALKASVAQLLDLDFDRVIVAHGEVLDSGGKAALREGVERRFGSLESRAA
ncbi:MAG: hypothetical protein IPM79_10300 [Polyangiaceae bacterium]|jgi:hypothetical protein|nr:hypothetical protein [Polyangiaceae bacterium]MBK8938013.1 hypothetical protein [Polyangiaceae bacterium]